MCEPAPDFLGCTMSRRCHGHSLRKAACMVIGLADDLAVIVISDGRITGIVTVSRLRQIIRRPALRAPSAR